MDVVLVMFRDGKRKDFPLARESTRIGRKDDCHLRIPTNDVSREHCEVVITDGGAKVRDLGSSNGTFINGRRVKEQDLGAGDRLGVGPVTFVVQIDGEPASISPEDAAPTLDESEDSVTPVRFDADEETDTQEILELDEDALFEEGDDEPSSAVDAIFDELDLIDEEDEED